MNLNLDQVDHVTLDLMVNQPQYERYLRAREADMIGKFEKAKRFYKKRIIEMTRELLKCETVNDIFVIQAFDAYAKSCITYFRNKDKNDTLQEEHMDECAALGYLPPIIESELELELVHSDNNNDEGDNDNDAVDLTVSSKRKLEILMCFDKHKVHVPTLDTFVIKTTPPELFVSKRQGPIPQLKVINLDDPKFKTKDIKPKPSKSKSKSDEINE